MLSKISQYKGHNSSIYAIIRKDADSFLTAAGDGYIVKWSASGKTEDGTLVASVDAKIFSISLVNENILVVGDMNGHVYWVDFAKNETVKNYPHHRKGVYAIHTAENYIITGGGNGFVTKWDIASMRPIESIQVSTKAIRDIYGVSAHLYLIACSDGSIYRLNADNMTVKDYYKNAHTNSVFCLTTAGDFLYSGGRDAHINQYKLSSGELLNRIPAHWFTVNDLQVIQEGKQIISASRDKKIRIWSTEDLSLLQSIDLQNGGHINSVNTIYYHPEHNRVFTAGDDRSIIGFDLT